jgi:ribosomal protein L37AE/L43A
VTAPINGTPILEGARLGLDPRRYVDGRQLAPRCPFCAETRLIEQLNSRYWFCNVCAKRFAILP